MGLLDLFKEIIGLKKSVAPTDEDLIAYGRKLHPELPPENVTVRHLTQEELVEYFPSHFTK